MKSLKCGDLMPGCKVEVVGKDINEVMAKASEHAKKDHGMNSIPPDVAAKVKAAIKEK
jgi:predicted small metal-binding protein